MANDERPRAPRAAPRRGVETVKPRTKGASPERPFDMWLQKQLHAMYDEIASEPLPGDLLNLIDHDAAETADDNEQSGTHGPGRKKS